MAETRSRVKPPVKSLALILAAAVLLAVAAGASYSSSPERPLYTIASISAPPEIDGRLDDPCWQTATLIGPFVVLGTGDPPTQETRAWAAYDDRALYLAFECMENRMADIAARQTARDSNVWGDDCVEVFLAPRPDQRRYFHLVVNSLDTQYDEREARNPAGWNGEWQSAATRAIDRWIVEIAIPFRSLAVSVPSMLDAWGINLARAERPHRELSQISPTVGSFHDVARFAHLVFAGPEAVTASIVSTGAPFVGEHKAEVRVRNNGARPARATLWAEVPGEREARTSVELAPFDSRVVTVPYEVYAEGDLKLMLCVADASGRGVLRSTSVAFHIESNHSRLTEIQQGLSRLRDRANERGLASDLDKANREAQRLVALAQDRKRWASGDRGDWERLTALVVRLDVRANRVRLRALTSDPGAGYAIGVESPLRKIRPDDPYRGPVGRAAEIWLSRNEYEPVQVVVAALDKALARVRVSATDLIGPGGARIGAHHVALNVVGLVHTRKPAYAVERVGWFPDPLMDAEPFDVKADGVQPLWVTVYCPATAPAGDYRGEIVIKADNAGEARVPLIAHVWDFTLPKETHLKTAFALSEGEIAAWYGYDRVPDEVRLRFYDFLLRRRINPTNIYSSTPVPAAKDMSFCISRGLNAFNIKCVRYADTLERRRAEVEAIRRYVQFLKEQGWYEGAYIYGFDEIRRADYPKLREMYAMISEACPGLPRVCTVVPNDDLKGFVDVWVPLTAAYDHEMALRYRASGDHVWWYVCCGPHHPYANWFVDYPATDPRLLFWMNWKYGTDGFLYYCLNNWASNRMVEGLPASRIPHDDPAARAAIAAGKRWPEVPWNTFTYSNFNGDGHLIYPGPEGKPLSSIRLECIRDGIEDYEYFYLLAGLAARLEGSERYRVMVNTAKRLLSVEPQVVKSLTEYTDDPELVERARRDLGNHIQAMSRVGKD